jgi:hypothetical protein
VRKSLPTRTTSVGPSRVRSLGASEPVELVLLLFPVLVRCADDVVLISRGIALMVLATALLVDYGVRTYERLWHALMIRLRFHI